MLPYIHALHDIMVNGEDRHDRTGVGTRGIFGHQSRYPLALGFPAVTTKKLAWRSVVSELLWFLEGSTDERRLCEILHGTRDPNKTTIWTANADNQGVALGYRNDDKHKELGPGYGKQWRDWGGDAWNSTPLTDQITSLIKNLKEDPFSRRHIISAWNVAELPKMALPPCHVMAQFHVSADFKLSCQLYQRSADMFLGVPFNIASYALLTHMLAQLTGLAIGDFIHTIGDAHIYSNHYKQVSEQIRRKSRRAPALQMPKFETLSELLKCSVDDFKLIGYDPHPAIKADMAI